MKKNKSLRKLLVIGGMGITLLAPLAVSTISPSNVLPATTITAQAKRRHKHHSHRYYVRRAKRAARKGLRHASKFDIKVMKKLKRNAIRKIRRQIRHSHKHSFRHEVLEARLRRAKHYSVHTVYGRAKIETLAMSEAI